MRIHLLLFPLALAACTAAPVSSTPAAEPIADSSAASTWPATLARYHWQLHDAVDSHGNRLDALFGLPDRPLQLDFADGRVRVRNACNGMGGSFLIVEDHLVVASMMHTMMACHDQTLMQRETTIGSLLQSKPTLILSTEGNAPSLTLASDDGHTLTFIGNPITETH
jgi:heat shock protein HslJ